MNTHTVTIDFIEVILMKLIKTIIAILLSISVLPCNIIYAETIDDPVFDEYMEEVAQDIMNSDYLTMHYTVSETNEETTDIAPGFTPISIDYFTEAKEKAEEVIDKLKQFDFESLSERQKTDYKAVMNAFIDQRDRQSDSDFTWFFTPTNNLVTTLATYLTEFRFYQKADFDNYIILLSSVPQYLDSAVEFTKYQAQRGYFMPDAALDESVSQIEEFIAETDENIIISAFKDAVINSELISDEEKETYISKVTDIVLNSIIPSCTNVINELSALRGMGIQTGYADIEGGKEYFEKMTQYYSSTDNTIEEQVEDLDKYLKTNLKKLASKIMTGYKPESFPDLSPEEILDNLSSEISHSEFPEIDETSYTLDYLDGSSVAGNVMAYYVNSPVDEYNDNVIVINNDIKQDSTVLYQTLAHEAFPGHLYQHVYYLQQNPLLIRSLLSFPGYSEGWGMYADYIAVHWGEVSEESAEYISTERAVNYALSAQIDLCVNGLGYSEDELKDYLEQLGLDGSTVHDYYNYALCYAGNYGSYGYGLVRLLSIKENAAYSLGDKYDSKEFYRIILNGGPRILDDVEADIIEWVESQNVEYKEPADNSSLIYILIVGGCAAVGVVVSVIANKRKKKK